MGSVSISNWGEDTYLASQKEYFGYVQANYDKWAQYGTKYLDQQRKDWKEVQESWQLKWAIAQAAYAAAQTYLADRALDAAKDQAEKQYDIANRQQDIAESEYGRYSEYFAPCENKSVREECERPEYREDIELQVRRAGLAVRAQMATERAMLNRRRTRYCIGAAVAGDRELMIKEMKLVAQAQEQTRRYLEEREFNRQQVYFNRKSQMLNLGKGIPAQTIQSYSGIAQITAAGSEIELAARNQFYGAVLSGLGGLIGAFVPNVNTPLGGIQGSRQASSIGVNTFGGNYAGPMMTGPQGMGGFGAGMV